MAGALRIVVAAALLGLFPGGLVPARPAAAARAVADLVCAEAARTAAQRTGIPYEVLLAIAQVETGRPSGATTTPWPWAINDSGDGHWFDSRAEAEAAAETLIAAGRSSFDIGCFQLNYRWHGAAFASISAMFEPESNALYAARFLLSLRREGGDWSEAAGAYHSRTPEHAETYRSRFDAALAALGGDAAAPATAEIAQVARTNDFPLLRAREGVRAPGSLVPLDL
ncbi:MAG: transglycosylase SLT domain-containing protein [Rubellimicrobium sp.]|nr:transglycosylase SLT domain-containing protein [Rubellimicrobium sp.]